MTVIVQNFYQKVKEKVNIEYYLCEIQRVAPHKKTPT
jgi:hypothetical protein